jgi:hypothetical protein
MKIEKQFIFVFNGYKNNLLIVKNYYILENSIYI